MALAEERELRFAAQYTDQQATGDELLKGTDFTGRQFGLKAELALGPALLTAAYTGTDDETGMQNPWSGYPGYTSVQVEDFNRAGEDALLLRASYNFPKVPGLSAYVLWVSGSDPESPTEYARDEYDFNLQWSPAAGALKGLMFRLRYAYIDQDDGSDLSDFRLMVYYDPPKL
jgi:predicted porin